MIIIEQLYENSMNNPNKIAVIEGCNEITYSELWSRIVTASRFYKQLASKGERVILAANKSVDFVYSYFGAQLAGLITVTVDTAVNMTRLRRIYESANPVAIFGNLDVNSSEFVVRSFPDITSESDDFDGVFPEENDLADILYTTGTTGFPKGVALSHYNEFCAASMINMFIGNNENDIELLALPISHSFGLGRLRCTVLKGGTLDMLGSFASMKKFYAEMDNRAITGFGMVPASWNYIKKMSGDKIKNYSDQLRYIEIGSAPMKLEDKKLLMEYLPNTRICMHYGLTEASRSAFICFNEDSDHLDSIGHPSPTVDIRIMDENGELVGCNKAGEICVKGGHVCCQYWGNDSEKYSDSFYGDYFRTGDWGFVDDNGYYHLVSRYKELINVGGKKVSPIEVEEIIDSIKGIEESACIGIPDDVMGEVVKAFVVRNDSTIKAEDIIKIVSRRIEQYKVPVIVEFIDQIPKTSSGKIQRLQLK